MDTAARTNGALRVAIIGGGVAGLSSAYYLMQRAQMLGEAVDIRLFEGKRTLGGAADTVVVDLGRYQVANGPQSHFLRWADLGVNDANLATYHLMKEMMTDIGFLQHMKPLQDTTCYHDPDNAFAWTDDSSLQDGVSDPEFSLANICNGRLLPLIRVVHRTALDLIGHIGVAYTCGHFFQDCIDDPRAMLGEAADGLGIVIDWTAPDLAQLLCLVRDRYYFPRISAMYFADPRGPATMPLQAPFEYYKLQEGSDAPQRCYFDHGAQHWLEALANHLTASSSDNICLTISTGMSARVHVTADSLTIRCADADEAFDVCLMATHADDAAQAIDFGDSAAEFGATVRDILGAVTYTRSYAVCHTADAQLPASRNAWRTYNIPIRSAGDSRFPYRIDYVANLHQNDPANPIYDHAGLPVFFVSLVDDLNRIPRQEMLDRLTDVHAVPQAMLELLPATTRAAMGENSPVETGYRHELGALAPELDRKAWTMFKHNVLDSSCIEAQVRIKELNLAWASGCAGIPTATTASRPALLFGGGWTCGAGLHEQCLQSSRELSTLILPG